MLIAQGVISGNDGAEILSGLDIVLTEIEGGDFEFKTSSGRYSHEYRSALEGLDWRCCGTASHGA